MITKRVSQQDLRRAFLRAVQAAEHANQVKGRMGKPTGVGTWVYNVPGNRGWKYVQIVAANGESASYSQARNPNNVPDTGNLPIWLDTNAEGKLYIVGERDDAS